MLHFAIWYFINLLNVLKAFGTLIRGVFRTQSNIYEDAESRFKHASANLVLYCRLWQNIYLLYLRDLDLPQKHVISKLM